jgi:hypothetical protein
MPRLAAVALWRSISGAMLSSYMQHVVRVPHLAHLDVSAAVLDMAGLAPRLVALPALASLVATHSGAWAGAFVRAGMRLPCLTRLVMGYVACHASDDVDDVTAMLAPMTGLQHLELAWGLCPGGYVGTLAPALAGLAQLRRLRLSFDVNDVGLPTSGISASVALWSAVSCLGLLTHLYLDVGNRRELILTTAHPRQPLLRASHISK